MTGMATAYVTKNSRKITQKKSRIQKKDGTMFYIMKNCTTKTYKIQNKHFLWILKVNSFSHPMIFMNIVNVSVYFLLEVPKEESKSLTLSFLRNQFQMDSLRSDKHLMLPKLRGKNKNSADKETLYKTRKELVMEICEKSMLSTQISSN